MRRRLRQFKPVWNPERKVWEGKLLEEHVLREIVERLWLEYRIKVWRINQPVGGKTPQNVDGLPDLWGFIPAGVPRTFDWKNLGEVTHHGGWPATPLMIECKRPGGARRPAQETFIAEARAGGCCAFFAESWDDVVRELREVGVRPRA